MIIQGGMGVAVSDWRLARAVALTGQMGVVSGTALDVVLARRLQMGDPGGHMRRALEALPFPGVGDRIVEAYFVDGGLEPGRPFTRIPMPRPQPSVMATDLLILAAGLLFLVAANFVEVHLAREGHSGQVGINYLEKIQLPTLPSLFGAMVAGVDFVLMGAGIPRAIPAVLDRMSVGKSVSLRFDVDAPGERTPEVTTFDPAMYLRHDAPPARPGFLGIVASHVLATMMARLESPPDGFIVEGIE